MTTHEWIEDAVMVLKVLAGYRGITTLTKTFQGDVYIGTVGFSPEVFYQVDKLLASVPVG